MVQVVVILISYIRDAKRGQTLASGRHQAWGATVPGAPPMGDERISSTGALGARQGGEEILQVFFQIVGDFGPEMLVLQFIGDC